jgi:hypothetical protein
MKPPAYSVVPHLDLFRITGLTGAAALVTFKEKKSADDVCRMLHAVYEEGARCKEQEIRDVLGIAGGRR